ncbi:ATP-binding protein [Nocardiopsis xinjiangensis]|uniref:ATP-binding protein n=1 Tax=Nocardiopsis xinjiangensis TaxID=124285 RepID=UPI000A032C04|nr:ATP-binding protein [Nocardiopsis xinjiangensis]
MPPDEEPSLRPVPPRTDGRAVFVGRERHVAALLDDAREVLSDGARAVFVRGEAGVGKTRLATEYLRRSPLGAHAVGGCVESGTDTVAFAPVTSVLRPLTRDHAPTPVEARELARILPELGEVSTVPDDGRTRLFESVLTFLERCAETGDGTRPGLAVVLEDLHWADASTRDLLLFLLRNLGRAPIQLVMTVRTDDVHRTHPLRRLVPDMVRLPRVGTADLGPLDVSGVFAQVASLRGRAPADAEAELLHERSGGNPLFVEALLAGGGGDGAGLPEGPRELMLRRVESLSDTTRGSWARLRSSAHACPTRSWPRPPDVPVWGSRTWTPPCARPSTPGSCKWTVTGTPSGTPSWPRPYGRTCSPANASGPTADSSMPWRPGSRSSPTTNATCAWPGTPPASTTIPARSGPPGPPPNTPPTVRATTNSSACSNASWNCTNWSPAPPRSSV